MNRREFLTGATALTGTVALAEEKTTDGGLAAVSWAEREQREVPVLPPGAKGLERFQRMCLGCHLCAAVCPTKIIRPSTALNRLGKVELDFRYGYCKSNCVKCGAVCPVNAIRGITVEKKRNIHIGYAVWHKDLCLRTQDGTQCRACVKHCPVKAIRLVEGFPVVNRDVCIGCGACEHYCPTRPFAAIRVVGVEQQREINPIGGGECK